MTVVVLTLTRVMELKGGGGGGSFVSILSLGIVVPRRSSRRTL